MELSKLVKINGRFQRSIRIDTDLNDAEFLSGFICPKSISEIINTMAKHIASTKQAAFTWTGPYGSGKSSLVVALSAALNSNRKLREEAALKIGKKTAEILWEAMPPKVRGWDILPVIGQRIPPCDAIGKSLEVCGFVPLGSIKKWTDDLVIEIVSNIAIDSPRQKGGLIIFLDEMGKFLEGAAIGHSDIYLFQRLAEAASRTNGRLIIVGILHQAFDEYAKRATREAQDEWAKVQGRFVDLAISIAPDEQIDLLSRAIISNKESQQSISEIAAEVAESIQLGRSNPNKSLANKIEKCWPLHPIVTCLLGPVSRRKFGQNQRSIFGFLNSAEPFGFRDFLQHGSDNSLYYPHLFWDYLKANLESSILVSSDGHRWSMAMDAIDRCERAEGAQPIHIEIIKTISLMDLFRERTGILASKTLILAAFKSRYTATKVNDAISFLSRISTIIYRKHINSYAIYAGSDFDIDTAIAEESTTNRQVNIETLRSISGVQPILAKRHYHETGAMRWFDVEIVPLSDLKGYISNFTSDSFVKTGAIGKFLLIVPTANETQIAAEKICKETAKLLSDDIIIGISKVAWSIVEIARDFISIKKISEERRELHGDLVAKREVKARLQDAKSQLESYVQQMMDEAKWYSASGGKQNYNPFELNLLASDIASKKYSSAPRIFNELLNRQKISPNAVTAQRALLKQMVQNESKPRLGIVGFPAEGGLFESILIQSGLYREIDGRWGFASPQIEHDPCGILPIWKAALEYLKKNSKRLVTIKEIYDLWAKEPYGVKFGLLPVLSIVFVLTQKDKLAFYRDGVFQPRFTSLEVDVLTNDPSCIQLRWMNISENSKKILSGLAEVVREIDKKNPLLNLEPIDVARGLISIYDELEQWTKRTAHLSSNALKIRNLFKAASDPNKFLFDDIPSIFGDEDIDASVVIQNTRDGLFELSTSYSSMIERLMQMMLTELQVPNTSPQALVELRERSENIRHISGDFRMNAFIGRLSAFYASISDMESITSLATSKPSKLWVDADLDAAYIEIATLAKEFIKLESLSRVRGRKSKRNSMTVVVGLKDSNESISGEFSISESERHLVEELVGKLETTLIENSINSENIILSALAQLSGKYLNYNETLTQIRKQK